MRGGGIGATLFAFMPLGLGISDIAAPIAAPLALICAVLGEPPAIEPPVRANETAGKAKTTKTKAIFIALFDIGNLHKNSLERRSVWSLCRFATDPPTPNKLNFKFRRADTALIAHECTSFLWCWGRPYRDLSQALKLHCRRAGVAFVSGRRLSTLDIVY
jgi:hypothetical protein